MSPSCPSSEAEQHGFCCLHSSGPRPWWPTSLPQKCRLRTKTKALGAWEPARARKEVVLHPCALGAWHRPSWEPRLAVRDGVGCEKQPGLSDAQL